MDATTKGTSPANLRRQFGERIDSYVGRDMEPPFTLVLAFAQLDVAVKLEEETAGVEKPTRWNNAA